MADSNNKIFSFLDKELKEAGDKNFALGRNRLIGKGIISYGVRTSEIRKITKKYFKKFQKTKTERDWFVIAEKLMSTKILDNQMAGIFFLSSALNSFEEISAREIKKMIIAYIDNWATCDTISSEVFAKLLRNSPEEIKVLFIWVKSKNIWVKRAALATTVKLKNKIKNWKKIASQVLSFSTEERELIVKKAARWLEKEIISS